MLRFREAVTAGAIPFTVQGPENALCLDGGRTLGWEIGEMLPEVERGWRALVQVGGGALAACARRGDASPGLDDPLQISSTEARLISTRGNHPPEVVAATECELLIVQILYADQHRDGATCLGNDDTFALGVIEPTSPVQSAPRQSFS